MKTKRHSRTSVWSNWLTYVPRLNSQQKAKALKTNLGIVE